MYKRLITPDKLSYFKIKNLKTTTKQYKMMGGGGGKNHQNIVNLINHGNLESHSLLNCFLPFSFLQVDRSHRFPDYCLVNTEHLKHDKN